MRADTTYLSAKDLAARWQLSVWSINDLARRRRIRGAVKLGRDWRFPLDAELLPESEADRHDPADSDVAGLGGGAGVARDGEPSGEAPAS